MAIRDLLWACPECGEACCLVAHRDGDQCGSCGMTFRRGHGSTIVATGAGGEAVSRLAREWVDMLPDMATVVDTEAQPPKLEVEARFGAGSTVVRKGSEYLGRVERFGPVIRGTLSIEDDGVRFLDEASAESEASAVSEASAASEVSGQSEESGASDHPRNFENFRAFSCMTAIQASSSTLQLKFRDEPVISLRFPDGSLRYLELRLQYAVQRYYEETGRGTIREYQPRIVAY